MEGLDRQLGQLLDKLDQLITLLTRCGDTRWVDWLAEDRSLLAAGDARGLDHLSAAFGGMGSLNDLVIHPKNAHTVEPGSIGRVNDELSHLRADVHRLVRALRRALS